MKYNSHIITLLFLCLITWGASCHSFPRGEQLFNDKCASCHMTDGTGLGALLPSLQYSEYLQDKRSEAPCLIKYGSPLSDTARLLTPMPGFKELDATDISNIINYMHQTWGNDLPATSPAEVRLALESCEVTR